MGAKSTKQRAANYLEESAGATAKYQALRDLDIFVLDNSIRESTVGQLRGHTLEAKWAIYEEVKKCGFKHTVVAAFSHMTRVDDDFIKELMERGEDPYGLWAFSEITEGAKNKVPDTEAVPISVRKLKAVGMYNVIFEVDLGDATYDFGKFTMADMCALVLKWIKWSHDNLGKNTKVMLNIRDPPDVMPYHPERVFELVEFLAKLPKNIRPFGILFEEPRGKSLPEEAGMWVKHIRATMKDNGWADGQLLVHVHEKFGYGDATVLQCLIDGSTGIWASVCAEGAALGNASSCVTLMNLIRLGNKKVLEKYNCTYLRKAAINATEITTGMLPHNKQPIFGPRATDFVFDLTPEEFDLAAFFGEKAPIRITTMASPDMILLHLKNLFGEDPQFTLDLAYKMKELILEDLRTERKEEYMSAPGIAMLFDRAGGKLTEHMRDTIEAVDLKSANATKLIKEIRAQWEEFDLKEGEQGGVAGDDMLQFDTFYNGFMAPYFSCYRCSDTYKALQAIDMDSDGQVDWSEFLVYLKWALYQYPNVETAQEVLNIAFTKGLIPAMRDEYLKQQAE
ncbi:uncharacterized protein LOC135496469 [Lineus longissimus]|uniref:uncharacterized protein LOC135496469 n=1 Tax=Lineus longissimus TaxID=88925 RepID=UPI002B4F5BA0